ncbi:UvrD-helicase domain-containing protein [Patescibacteria group bacterium]|nr:UvrD-helicase domain-containing protein [Patescibacteria group bacterium]MBU4512581.1 UvrD-helicase domain-containing protein [Patescibacteria group bacterium]MCG2693353.1 UvrD-helicase domain-containing protein [Candidatus Parcubacteria bacterium]
MNELLNQLNAKQAQAVQMSRGPVLVLAGAGSGKTRTLTYRIAYLIQNRVVRPGNILAVTFTNKAAGEMKERVDDLLKIEGFGRRHSRMPPSEAFRGSFPLIGTFHSVSARILRKEAELLGYKKSFTIYDSTDQLGLIKRVMKELQLNPKEIAPRAIHSLISKAKNNLIDVDEYESRVGNFIQEITAQVYRLYQYQLKENQAFDFDDLIMKLVELWLKHPQALAKYQHWFKYILVDEYQDVNQAQYVWTQMLAQAHRNLYVVGDDAQSIYGWRGANMKNILNFEKDYPEAQVVFLEQNYRSTQAILNLGNALIKNNTRQKQKDLWTRNDKGFKPEVWEVEDEWGEGELVLRKVVECEGLINPKSEILNSKKIQNSKFKIQNLDEELTYEYEEEPKVGLLDRVLAELKGKRFRKDEDVRQHHLDIDFAKADIEWNKYVVLYRVNAQSRALEEVFMDYGVPYRIIGGVKFYERKEVKDTLAYLRLLNNPDDFVSLRRIINEPSRGIGVRSVDRIEQACKEQMMDIFTLGDNLEKLGTLRGERREAFKRFGIVIRDVQIKMRSLTVSEIIDLILTKSGYKDYLLDGSEENKIRWENVQELKTVATKYDSRQGQEGLEAFLEEAALMTDIDALETESSQAVTLMTLHAAKGLEFPVVFVVGLEEGLFPHSNSMESLEEVEEERRLCYVGITRAKQRLYLAYARQRMLYGNIQVNPPSRFLEEVPEELVERNNVE